MAAAGRKDVRVVDLALLALVAAGVGAGAWMARSTFLPVPHAAGIDYLFVASPFGTFAGWGLGAFCALIAIHAAVRSRTAGGAADVGTLERVGWTAPLLLLPLLLLPLLALRGAPSRAGVILAYLLIDLRSWFIAGALALCVPAVARRLRWQLDAVAGRAPSWFPAVSLVAVLMAFGFATSPPKRFESSVVGNEPKYVRYLETFYQGHGFAIDDNALFDDFVPGSADRGAQARALLGGAAAAARDLSGDLVERARGGEGLVNRARYRGASFVIGKDGSTYQLHTPGLPFVLYPFYYVDRQYLDNEAGYRGQLPRRLTCTSAALLGLHALWGLAIFRLLAAWTGNRLQSWFLALTMMVTMPVTAFNYQYYPEAAAGLALTLMCHAVVFPAGDSWRHGFLHGLLAGWLPWLHVRFLVVSLVCAGGFVVVSRRKPRTLAAFAIGYVVCLALLGLYFYNITGSPLPSAMYDVMPQRHFALANIPVSLTGFLLDRDFGVLPYAPIFVLAFVGLRPLLSERHAQTAFVALVAGALVMMASAFREWPSGSSTPARMIVAVVPLAALSMAHAFRRFGASRFFGVAAALLWAVSVDVSAAYNSHLSRSSLVLVDDSFSGWKPTLIFPSIVRFAREPDAPARTAFWLGAILAITLFAWWRAGRRSSDAPAAAPWERPAILVATILLGSLAAGPLTRPAQGFSSQYLADPGRASEVVLERFMRDGCAPCLSVREGALSGLEVTWRLPPPRARQPGPPVSGSHEQVLDVHLSPGRDAAGTRFTWGLPGSPGARVRLEIHARTARADPSVAFTLTVLDQQGRLVAERAVKADELGADDALVVPVYLAVDRAHGRLQAVIVYGGTSELWIEKLVAVVAGPQR